MAHSMLIPQTRYLLLGLMIRKRVVVSFSDKSNENILLIKATEDFCRIKCWRRQVVIGGLGEYVKL